jgi:glycine cleavage system H protein
MMAEIPNDCRYSEEHEWVRPDGPDYVKVGITDYAQDQLGDIVFVEFPEQGASLEQANPFGVIESVKVSNELYSPISGEVEEINTALQDDPSLVNQSPYGDGWMIRVRLSDPTEIENLLTPEKYEELVKGLEG